MKYTAFLINSIPYKLPVLEFGSLYIYVSIPASLTLIE